MGSFGNWRAYLRYDEKTDQPALTRDLLLRVWDFAKPYNWQVAGLLFAILLTTGLSLISPLLMRSLIDDAIPNGNIQLLNILAVGLVFIPLANGLIGVWQRSLGARVGEGVICDLRQALYGHLQRMSLRFFTKTRTGELMSRMNNDVIGAQRAVSDTIVTIISNFVTLVGALAIMIALDWRLTLLSVAVLPLFFLPARRIGRTLRGLRRESMEYNAEMNATMNETLNVSGALLVKLFGREQREMDRFQHDAVAVRDIGVRSAVISRWFFMLLSVVGGVGTAVVYWVGGLMTIEGVFTIGTIVAFGAYLRQLYSPLMALTNAPVEFVTSMVSFERVFEVLDLPIEIEEKPDAVALPHVEGAISFEHVYFDYTAQTENTAEGLQEIARLGPRGSGEVLLKRGRQRSAETDDDSDDTDTEQSPIRSKWALNDINFEIEPGQLVALVGPSGAGKTTITYMIPRLYDPTDGTVRIDGHDLRDVTLQSLSDNIGMVTQETYLFYDTIRANLLYAYPDATSEQMVAAARAANIHDFIASLPDGYDTVVGERGYRLSGGERQRMAIARVILKNPRILVLDEATSSLDSLSEALIQEALGRVMEGRTSFVIAHRLSTILAADRILVMRHGQLVEQGTHDELLEQGGLYTELYETQFRA